MVLLMLTLRLIQGKRKDSNGSFDFFACPDEKCKATFPNDAGKPGKAKEKSVYHIIIEFTACSTYFVQCLTGGEIHLKV